MNWDWILHPAMAYVLAGTGLLLCVYLFLAAKRELRRAGLEWNGKLGALEEEVRLLRETLQHTRGELEELRDASATLVEPPVAISGLNLSKRTQALRMHRRGEPAERIASALLMPRQEVELLQKVEQLAAE